MSQESTEGGNTSGTTPAADEFTPITSQEEFNKAVGKRVERERAKFSDYDDLAAKAAKYDEVQQANQTEAEKAAARITELESELSTTRTASLRLKVAAENGITDPDDIDLFLTGSDEETLTRQAKRLSERQAASTKNGNHVPSEGNNQNTSSDPNGDFVRDLFGSGG